MWTSLEVNKIKTLVLMLANTREPSYDRICMGWMKFPPGTTKFFEQCGTIVKLCEYTNFYSKL